MFTTSRKNAFLTAMMFTATWLCSAREAFAWSAAGHRIVANIAYDRLDPALRSSIVKVLRAGEDFAERFAARMPEEIRNGMPDEQDRWIFLQASIWPDLIRSVPKYHNGTWHYIDIPYYLSDLDKTALGDAIKPNVNMEVPAPLSDDERAHLNCVQALKLALRALKDPHTPDSQKAIYYCWVMHILGDGHQPLHSVSLISRGRFNSSDGDKGGNGIKIMQASNLHSFWDGLLGGNQTLNEIRKRSAEIVGNDEFKSAAEKAAARTAPEIWIKESYDLAKRVVYDKVILDEVAARDADPAQPLMRVDLPLEYRQAAGHLAQRRVAEAGYRLAELLKEAQAELPVDFSHFKSAHGTQIRQDGSKLRLSWRIAKEERGVLVLELKPKAPLIQELGVVKDGSAYRPLLTQANPVFWITVGQRDLSAQGWNVFFDSPFRRPHETFAALLEAKNVRVTSQGRQSTVVIDGLSAGPFQGELRFSVYADCRLVQAEAVVSTTMDACAFIYDAGLMTANAGAATASWVDTNDVPQRVRASDNKRAEPVAARHRAIIAELEGGAVAIFPPPHQFIYPLDFADNFQLVWHGHGYRGTEGWGMGVRQPPEGDKRHVPWVNAPPGSRQRLNVFYLPTLGNAQHALEEVRRFTHGDHFKKLDGYKTFTHHYHIEHTLDFLAQQRKQKTDGIPRGLEVPPFVKAFKAQGVDIVHLAEFHVTHTPEMNAKRLELLATMHSECRRLSDGELLVLPGEEPNVHLGGHWISLFPRPVNWLLHPKEGTPFEQQLEGKGTVYAVHNPQEVLRLMENENGLMWTAHPRTKGSYGFPDRYRDKDFYLSSHFLGAGWKHMPADYSQPRLGMRALDLLDDMPSWGQRKYLLGEVDIFKVHSGQELYGHMNINYLKLAEVPRFDDGWASVLDTLRQGRFFVSTGEVLIRRFEVGGKESGETLPLSGKSSQPTEVRAELEWTFPPAFAEIIWGDGKTVSRHRVDLSESAAFGNMQFSIPLELRGAKWVRLEVWDIAANGAFTQPVWVE